MLAAGGSSTATMPDFGQVPLNAYRDIPRYVQYTSPVSTAGESSQPTATTLPLNLILLIISFLDDIADIARVTRTSRLLYYMTLPQLYERVVLRSYGEVRYTNGRPEGYGGGSPFNVALNGLVTKPHAQLVKKFKLTGAWKEPDLEDFGKGRVPDKTMMLNVLMRAALDKMTKLQTFVWSLDCKPLKTVYQGLGQHETLTNLTLRFPASREPRPCCVVPAMPNLKVFKVLDIDPLGSPDDISWLLLNSRKLEDLRMHFNPRLRREAEAIISLDAYFGQCRRAGYKLKLKHFALQNFISYSANNVDQLLSDSDLRSCCFLDVFGGAGGDPRTLFADDMWKLFPRETAPPLTAIRHNEVAMEHVAIMRSQPQTLESLIMVSEREFKFNRTGNTPGASVWSPMTPDQTSLTPDVDVVALTGPYIDVITKFQGTTLRKLLLSDQFGLSASQLGDLIRCCPNLEQFGFALNSSDHNIIRLLAPFLKKIRAMRVLNNAALAEHMRLVSHEDRMWGIGFDVKAAPPGLPEFLGIGDVIYRIGREVTVEMPDGGTDTRREVTIAEKDDVRHIEIWSLDNLDIGAD